MHIIKQKKKCLSADDVANTLLCSSMEPWKFQKKNNYDKKTCLTTLITIFYTLNLIIACYMVHFHRQMHPKEYKVGSCHTPGQNCQLLVDTFYILGDTLIKELSNCRADVSTTYDCKDKDFRNIGKKLTHSG